MKSYLVEIEFFQDSSVEFLHFISDSPIWSSVIHGASNIASSVVGSVGKIRGL